MGSPVTGPVQRENLQVTQNNSEKVKTQSMFGRFWMAINDKGVAFSETVNSTDGLQYLVKGMVGVSLFSAAFFVAKTSVHKLNVVMGITDRVINRFGIVHRARYFLARGHVKDWDEKEYGSLTSKSFFLGSDLCMLGAGLRTLTLVDTAKVGAALGKYTFYGKRAFSFMAKFCLETMASHLETLAIGTIALSSAYKILVLNDTSRETLYTLGATASETTFKCMVVFTTTFSVTTPGIIIASLLLMVTGTLGMMSVYESLQSPQENENPKKVV